MSREGVNPRVASNGLAQPQGVRRAPERPSGIDCDFRDFPNLPPAIRIR